MVQSLLGLFSARIASTVSSLVLEDTMCPGMASLWPQGYCTCGSLLSGAYLGSKAGLALNVYGQLLSQKSVKGFLGN